MEDIKFNLNTIEQTFARYSKNEMLNAVIISKRTDGAVCNIGGKSDGFIQVSDFSNYDEAKVGDRFKVVVLGTKTEDGMVLVSKSKADDLIVGSTIAEKIKIGSQFSFVATGVRDNGLVSKLGAYTIIIPEGEIDSKITNPNFYKNKQLKAIATEINKEQKLIVGSVKILTEQIQQTAQTNFWNSMFINKVVMGVVKKIMPYGAFVDVNGVDCFIHISDVSYSKVENLNEFLVEGKEYQFRIIKLDKETKKVSLGIKQLQDNPKIKLLKELSIGDRKQGTIIKLLPFGAIVKLENGIEGLLHINDATENREKRIYEIVSVNQIVNVEVKSIDMEKNRVNFILI